jgi:serine protease Do
MRSLERDRYLARGGAAVLLALGVAAPAAGQGPVPARRDTIVRIIDPTMRVQLESVTVLMRMLQRQPGMSDESLRLRREIDALMSAAREGNRIFIGGHDGPMTLPAIPRKGWLGITTGDAPMTQEITSSGHYVRYFAHPAIISVDRDSPAQAAGIVAGDSLIAYDGVDVVGRTLNLNELVVPDRKLGITIRRGGEDKDYQVTIAKAPVRVFIRQQVNGDDPAERIERVFTLPPGEVAGRARAAGVGAGVGARAAMPVIVNGEWINAVPRAGGFTLSANGVFGASMMTLEPVLAKSLDRPAGVLVRDVPEATVAARAGLLPGDVIVAVGGQSVATVGDVQLASVNRAENRAVTLKVVRDKKTRNIVVTWNGPPSP